MARFPLFLELAGRRVVVAGGGAVGRRKAAAVAEAGARVLVIDPAPTDELRDFVRGQPSVRLEARRFEADDVRGAALAFACTGDPAVNEAVASAASAAGVPAVLAGSDDAAKDYTTGAVLRRGPVVVAVSTEGAGPALAARLRDLVATVVGDEAGEAARLLGRLREGLKAAVGDVDRRRRAVGAALDGGLLDSLRDGRRGDAEALVESALDSAVQEERTQCTR